MSGKVAVWAMAASMFMPPSCTLPFSSIPTRRSARTSSKPSVGSDRQQQPRPCRRWCRHWSLLSAMQMEMSARGSSKPSVGSGQRCRRWCRRWSLLSATPTRMSAAAPPSAVARAIARGALHHRRPGTCPDPKRGRHDWSERFPRIREALASLRARSVTIDGEAVCVAPTRAPRCFDWLNSSGLTARNPGAYESQVASFGAG